MLDNFHHYHSTSHDPYLNLAFEAFLLANLDGKYNLFTFSNRPCVVFGNFQNPWIECNLLEMKNDDVLPVRRFSGGGAVYHDLGNLNLSFLRPTRDHGKEENTLFMQSFLRDLGLPVFVNSRSDLRIQGADEKFDRKISGSAFKQKKDCAYHHMTLLCETDLVKLDHYLLSKLTHSIKSKSIESVRSKVANLSEYNSQISPDFIASKLKMLCPTSTLITPEDLINIPFVKETYEEMKRYAFIFGKTPKMEFYYSDGDEKYLFEVNKTKIKFEVIKSETHPSFCIELTEFFNKAFFGPNLLLSLAQFESGPYKKEIENLINFLKPFF